MEELIHKYYNILQDYNNIYKLDDKLILDNINIEINEKQIFISLSGGVDSMVLLDIIKKKNPDIEICAIHINYNNRKETKEEQMFLEEYCKILNVKFNCLEISIKRDASKRKDYEEITKNLRFNFYKRILKENNSNNNNIFIAHHKDDLIENIFTNFCRGRNILDISALHYSSIIQKINIIRPMLNIYKSDIYNYAHYYNIPYFLDTTPLWSIRGQLRNSLFKLINICFPAYKENLLKFVKESNDWNKLILNTINNYYSNNVEFINNNIVKILFTNEYNYESPICFWHEIFKRIFHFYNLNAPSKKSLDNLMKSYNSNCKIKISNNCIAYYNTDNEIILTFN